MPEPQLLPRRLKLVVLRHDDGPVYGIAEVVPGFESRDHREMVEQIDRLEGRKEANG